MKSALTESKGLKRKLELVIPSEDVREVFSTQYEKIQKKAKLSGFRKGKIPLNILKQNYGDVAWKETLDHLFQKFYPQALQKNSLYPAGSPTLLNVKLEENKPCTLTLELEVHPEIKVTNYLKLKLTKQETHVSDKEFEEALHRLQEFSAELKDCPEGKILQKGDLASVDLACSLKGQLFKKFTSSDYVFMVGQDLIAPDFDKNLIGLKAKEKKDFNFTFLKTHPESKIAGETLSFKVKIKKIQQQILPELNEELAKKYKAKDVAELKQKIKEDLTREKEKNAKQRMENEIAEKLMEANPLTLPESLVKESKKELMEKERKRLEGQGASSEQLDKLLKEREEDFEKAARKELHFTYLIRKLISDLKITPSEKDIEKSLKTLLPTAKPDEAKKTLKANKRWDSLMAYATHTKMMDYLIENAEIV